MTLGFEGLKGKKMKGKDDPLHTKKHPEEKIVINLLDPYKLKASENLNI